MSSIRQQVTTTKLLHVRTRTTRYIDRWMDGWLVVWKKDDSQRHKCNATQKFYIKVKK